MKGYKEFYFTASVANKTEVELGTFSVTAGTWLFIGHLDWNTHQDCVYNFNMCQRIVRGNGSSGGGIINAYMIKTTSTQTYSVKGYHNGSATMTARCRVYAIKLG